VGDEHQPAPPRVGTEQLGRATILDERLIILSKWMIIPSEDGVAIEPSQIAGILHGRQPAADAPAQNSPGQAPVGAQLLHAARRGSGNGPRRAPPPGIIQVRRADPPAGHPLQQRPVKTDCPAPPLNPDHPAQRPLRRHRFRRAGRRVAADGQDGRAGACAACRHAVDHRPAAAIPVQHDVAHAHGLPPHRLQRQDVPVPDRRRHAVAVGFELE